MASLLDADLPSDDEEDEDFNPTGVEFEGGAKKSAARSKRGLMELADEEAIEPTAGDSLHRMLADKLADAMDDARYAQPPPMASSDEERGPARRSRAPAKKQKKGWKAAKQQASALTELRSAQQSAKVDAVWAALRGGRSGGGEQTPQTGASTTPDAVSGAVPAAGNSGTAVGSTMDGIGQSSGGVKGLLARKPGFSVASLCREVKKPDKRGDDTAWMRQLGMTSKPRATTVGGSTSGAARSAAAAALAAAKSATSSKAVQQQGSVTLTETRRFAGKDVQMERSVTAAEAKVAAQQQAASGLDAMLMAIGGSKKVNVLDKSRSDWGEVKKDNKVEAELEEYKKSGDKYLDRQDFLKRAELREYEKERDQRLGADVRNRGRL